MSTNNPIKLMTIIFEEPVQIGDVSMHQYQVSDHSLARYDAHLHGDLQCVALRDRYADSTIFVPIRHVRTMEAADKHNIPTRSNTSSEGTRDMQKQMRACLTGQPTSEAPREAPKGYTRGQLIEKIARQQAYDEHGNPVENPFTRKRQSRLRTK